MKIKTSKGLKVVIIAVALLLCLALAIGITGAFYQAKRQATGTLSMDQGIIIDYNGFDKTVAEDWATWTRGVTLPLFKTNDAQPGQNIPVNAAGIRANEKSVNFYARVKLSYKFYNGETPVEFAESTKLIKTSSSFFGTNWVESGDGYYYYATGSTLNKFEKGATATTPFVNLFATDAKFIIEGAGFTGANNNGEGGGFVDGTTSINKIEVYLTLETLQGDATAEQAKALGWEIGGAINPTENQEENFDKNRLLDETGNELDPNNTDLTENTTYQVVDEQGNGYKFTYALNESNKTATITGYVGTPTSLDIPKTIKVKQQDYVVTSIGDLAFCNYTDLMSISIPDSIKSIGRYAFYGCSSLQPNAIEDGIQYLGNEINKFLVAWQITDKNQTNYLIKEECKVINSYCFIDSNMTDLLISKNVVSIGEGAFMRCTGLTSIIIPDNVVDIRDNTFDGCIKLRSVTLPKYITQIPDAMFQSCKNLALIDIPNGVTKIGMSAFTRTNLSNIVIPETVISIDDAAFCYCESLESIVLKKGLLYIGSDVFDYCHNLRSISIPEGVREIKANTFFSCWNLTTIVIPDSVISIRARAFSACSHLSSIVFSNNLISIGEEAFSDCRELSSITIPNSVTIIEKNAFQECGELKSVTLSNNLTSLEDGVFNYCSSLETINIPNSVTNITARAFFRCLSLKTIQIPKNVASIGGYAFVDCDNLTTTIGDGWIKVEDGSAVDASTLLKKITYDIKRV